VNILVLSTFISQPTGVKVETIWIDKDSNNNYNIKDKLSM